MYEVCWPLLRPWAAFLGLLLPIVVVPAAQSEEPRLSISGYDPVAYFTDGKRFQANPNSNISGTDCAGATHRNTTAIARWASGRTPHQLDVASAVAGQGAVYDFDSFAISVRQLV
jgi:hypothetical protein